MQQNFYKFSLKNVLFSDFEGNNVFSTKLAYGLMVDFRMPI